MKKIISLVLAMMIMTVSFAQDIYGSWNGSLNAGNQSLEIIFHFTHNNNTMDCYMDVPAQSLKHVHIQIVKLTETQIELKSSFLSASFKGEIMSPNLIKGTWSQPGTVLPLELKPGSGKKINRPQEPKEPFEYQFKEIAFQNKKDNVWFGATLTYPVNYKPENDYPVVLMVSGSGQENRDEEIYSHKPFLVLADYLARHGIASLRYDDRGIGKSTGAPWLCTTEDFTEDAKAGIEHLKKNYRFDKIGVIGHSEGGTIAFKLAAKQDVDFIVSMAGTALKGDTLMVEQMNAMNKMAGLPANLTIVHVKKILESQSQFTPWMNYFFEYNPATTISTVNIPVMAINGSKDFQVNSKSNLGLMRKLLKNKNAKNLIKEYSDLNHLFQHCHTGSPNEYFENEETLSPEIMKDIADWINSL